MKKLTILILSLLFLAACNKKIEINQKLPEDAIVEDLTILVSEIEKKKPQTIEFNDGKVVTFEMPDKIEDGAIIKVGKLRDSEFTYFVKVKVLDDKKK